MPLVTVYSKPSCGGCVATKVFLKKKGIEFAEAEFTPEALDRFVAAGKAAAPVVEISIDGGEPELIAGFSVAGTERISELLGIS